MNKLLTLKDLEEKDKLNLYRDPSSIKIKNGDLKAAAIERWWYFKEQHDMQATEYYKMLDRVVMDFIVNFFNLTEEDLK